MRGTLNMESNNYIIRLSKYKNALIRLKKLGIKRVFSTNIADACSTTSTQIRKDFSLFGITGKKRGGYILNELLDDLNKILGKDKVIKSVLVGVGKLGLALMKYDGFHEENIDITCGFDIDLEKSSDEDVNVKHLSELKNFIKENKIEIGIITTGVEAAPLVYEIMVKAGIKGVLNFAPIELKKYDSCIVKNVNIVTQLEHLIYFVRMNGVNDKKNI